MGAPHVARPARAGAARAGARLARQVAVDAGHQEAQVRVKASDLSRDGRRAGVRAGRARGRAGRQPLVRAQLRGGRQLRRLREAPGDLRAGLGLESGLQASRGAGPGAGGSCAACASRRASRACSAQGGRVCGCAWLGTRRAGGQEPCGKQLLFARTDTHHSMYRRRLLPEVRHGACRAVSSALQGRQLAGARARRTLERGTSLK
jgi:hypothetical protein